MKNNLEELSYFNLILVIEFMIMLCSPYKFLIAF